MSNKMQQRGKDEEGFTLIELLVVILIIGILAAIAIPSFLNQKNKANDASAKELARTSETAAETFATDHSSSYLTTAGASFAPSDLVAIEPTINTSSTGPNAYLSAAVSTASTYSVTTISLPTNNTFTVARDTYGNVTRTCTIPSGGNAGGCQNVVGTSGTW